MASRISQMRNAIQPQQGPTPILAQQQQMNNSIQQTRMMMQQIRNAQDPQAMLAQMLQNNPNTSTIAAMLNNGGDLENMARQMAKAKGIDINQLINQLQGGM